MASPADDHARKPRRSRFFYVRVALLLALLFGVLLWAWRDVRSRRARNDWDHTLTVAIVPVRVERVGDKSVAALRARVPAMQDRLSAELERVRPGAPHPFLFKLVEPVDGSSPPPLPTGDGTVDITKHSLAVSSWAKDIDAFYPQRYADVMTRNRPTSATSDTVPGSFDEIAVGPATAREIGWLRSP